MDSDAEIIFGSPHELRLGSIVTVGRRVHNSEKVEVKLLITRKSTEEEYRKYVYEMGFSINEINDWLIKFEKKFFYAGIGD